MFYVRVRGFLLAKQRDERGKNPAGSMRQPRCGLLQNGCLREAGRTNHGTGYRGSPVPLLPSWLVDLCWRGLLGPLLPPGGDPFRDSGAARSLQGPFGARVRAAAGCCSLRITPVPREPPGRSSPEGGEPFEGSSRSGPWPTAPAAGRAGPAGLRFPAPAACSGFDRPEKEGP